MKRTVTFGGEGGDGACRYFRAEIPAKALRQTRRWSTSVASFILAPQTQAEQRRDPRIRGWNGPGSHIAPPSSIVTLRIMDDVVIDPATGRTVEGYRMENMADDIRRAREAGQIVLYDVDDDLWHLPEWSPAARAMNKLAPNVRACDLDVVSANIEACSGIITSTEYLADVLRQRFSVPVYVVRPGIDMDAYSYKRKEDSPLRVGFMGSISHHLPHLRTVQPALDCLPKFEAEFIRLGFILGDNSEVLLRELPCRVGRQVPWGGVRELPEKLAQLHIGIIPRVGEVFHEGQSVTSGLQYAAAGVPFLASPTAEYERLEHQGAGKVCRGVPDWRQALSDLLEFDDYRRTEGEKARECVAVEFGLEATGARYAELFGRLLDGHQ